MSEGSLTGRVIDGVYLVTDCEVCGLLAAYSRHCLDGLERIFEGPPAKPGFVFCPCCRAPNATAEYYDLEGFIKKSRNRGPRKET